MTNVKQLKGIIPVLLSPLKSDLSPDLLGTDRLVNFLINAGVGGFWALGSASEDINLSKKNRLDLLKQIVKSNNERVPIITGTGLVAIDEILSFFDDIAELPLDGIHILPYDVKMGDARLVHFFTLLADRSPFPIWMYHNPKRGRSISLDVINEVSQHKNIAGIKVGGYNLTEMLSIMMCRSDNFDVIGAGSGQLYSMLSLGAKAHTTSEASAFPEPFIELYKAYQLGELDNARKQQFDLIKLAKQFPRTENGEYAAEEKYILTMRNICDDFVNPLYRRLSAAEKINLRELLVEYKFPWA
jgi:dihydrodipicolinate synthase/N-acetylneuraminate lyase